jgi:hypothetical protein
MYMVLAQAFKLVHGTVAGLMSRSAPGSLQVPSWHTRCTALLHASCPSSSVLEFTVQGTIASFGVDLLHYERFMDVRIVLKSLRLPIVSVIVSVYAAM